MACVKICVTILAKAILAQAVLTPFVLLWFCSAEIDLCQVEWSAQEKPTANLTRQFWADPGAPVDTDWRTRSKEFSVKMKAEGHDNNLKKSRLYRLVSFKWQCALDLQLVISTREGINAFLLKEPPMRTEARSQEHQDDRHPCTSL